MEDLKKQIPKKTIKVGDKEVQIYEWITAEEEAKFQGALIGTQELEIGGGKKNVVTRTVDDLIKSNKLLIVAYLANISYDEYAVMKPSDRAIIDEAINKQHNKKK